MIIVIIPVATFRAEWVYPMFYIGIFLFCWFLPYVVSSSASILSKAASKDQQSQAQTIRTCGEVGAQIFGPFWVPSMFEISQSPGLEGWQSSILMWQLVFMTLCMALTIISWEYMKPEGTPQIADYILIRLLHFYVNFYILWINFYHSFFIEGFNSTRDIK